jgi:hypothetical protein
MLMNLTATAFGDYCYKANIAMFTQKRGKAGAAAPELVRMKGQALCDSCLSQMKREHR